MTSINISKQKKKAGASFSYGGRDDDQNDDDALSLQEASVQTQKSDWWSICWTPPTTTSWSALPRTAPNWLRCSWWCRWRSSSAWWVHQHAGSSVWRKHHSHLILFSRHLYFLIFSVSAAWTRTGDDHQCLANTGESLTSSSPHCPLNPPEAPRWFNIYIHGTITSTCHQSTPGAHIFANIHAWMKLQMHLKKQLI